MSVWISVGEMWDKICFQMLCSIEHSSKCPFGTIFVFVRGRILLLGYLYFRFLVTFDNNLLEQNDHGAIPLSMHIA